jgi:hypothetical protein
MGEVYAARDTRLDRRVAVKVLAASLQQTPEMVDRFEREARAVASLSHPHICVLHDVGPAEVGGDQVRYLVMEHLEGETLAARIGRGRGPLNEALVIAAQIANALDPPIARRPTPAASPAWPRRPTGPSSSVPAGRRDTVPSSAIAMAASRRRWTRPWCAARFVEAAAGSGWDA